MTTNQCPNCQTVNREGARFCANCGTTLAGISSAAEAKQAEQQELSTGTILQGRYRLEGELGRGGFGAVYRAWDINLNRPCAVKENLETSPESQRQFTREATVLANLSHPNLPRVIDHFIIQGQGQYLVMDFVAGEDLVSLLERQGIIGVEQALEWMTQVADALVYLHSRQPSVLHRDIKPANIRITPDNRAMLVDFGLVKMYDPHSKTTVGARAVTPGYAPPEQYGQGRTDSRTDIYALGATLYKMLTNKEPLESVQRMAGVHMQPVHEVNPRVPRMIGRIVEHAMILDPDERYQKTVELKSALVEGLARLKGPSADPYARGSTVVVEPVAGAQARPVVRTPPAPGRAVRAKKGGNRTLIGLGVAGFAAVCVLVSIAVGAFFLNMQQEQRRQEQTALAKEATETTIVKNTRTEEARITAQAQASLTALAGGTATVQARAMITAEAQASATAKAQQTSTAKALGTEIAMEAIRATADAPASWYIESLDSTVTSLNFYYQDESEEKIYGTSFDQDIVNRIYYELNLDHHTKDYRTFTLTIIYYFPDESVKEFTSEHFREADWDSSWHTSSWGWDEPGNFPVGTYQVDIFLDGEKVATGTFEIYD